MCLVVRPPSPGAATAFTSAVTSSWLAAGPHVPPRLLPRPPGVPGAHQPAHEEVCGPKVSCLRPAVCTCVALGGAWALSSKHQLAGAEFKCRQPARNLPLPLLCPTAILLLLPPPGSSRCLTTPEVRRRGAGTPAGRLLPLFQQRGVPGRARCAGAAALPGKAASVLGEHPYPTTPQPSPAHHHPPACHPTHHHPPPPTQTPSSSWPPWSPWRSVTTRWPSRTG